MTQITNFFLGVLVLLLGIPLGSYLAKETKEELKDGQVWFKMIILLSLVGILVSLFFGSDFFLFTFAFIAIVTSRSLRLKG